MAALGEALSSVIHPIVVNGMSHKLELPREVADFESIDLDIIEPL